MVAPSDAISVIAKTLEKSSEMPSSVSYLTQEADVSGGDANIKLPVVELQPVSSIHLDEFNTDEAERVQRNGKDVGRVYHSEYTLTVQLDIWSANKSRYDVDELGKSARSVLYPHDSAGPGKPFRVDIDGDGIRENIESIWRFKIDDGERADDLAMTPSLRRWRNSLTVYAYEEFRTDEEYIVDVNFPSGYTE